MLNRDPVSVDAEPSNHALGAQRHVRMMAEAFPLMDIRDMDL